MIIFNKYENTFEYNKMSNEKGKTNLVIGQSGSGKTVFLKCLLGLFEPDEGNICYNGQIYSELSTKQKRNLRQEMGMVFQGSALFDSMTVEGNVMFPLDMFTKQSQPVQHWHVGGPIRA